MSAMSEDQKQELSTRHSALLSKLDDALQCMSVEVDLVTTFEERREITMLSWHHGFVETNLRVRLYYNKNIMDTTQIIIS